MRYTRYKASHPSPEINPPCMICGTSIVDGGVWKPIDTDTLFIHSGCSDKLLHFYLDALFDQDDEACYEVNYEFLDVCLQEGFNSLKGVYSQKLAIMKEQAKRKDNKADKALQIKLNAAVQEYIKSVYIDPDDVSITIKVDVAHE